MMGTDATACYPERNTSVFNDNLKTQWSREPPWIVAIFEDTNRDTAHIKTAFG